MRALWSDLGRMHPVPRWTVRGMLVAGAAGALLGLVAGTGYLPTIWAAVLEGAFLGGAAGTVLGFVAGLLASAAQFGTRAASRSREGGP